MGALLGLGPERSVGTYHHAGLRAGPDSSDKDAYGEQEYGRVKNQPADSL